ncbi:nli interacting factor-like phosphatase family protein [Stylonychia lemnae]|uniref:Nli interacting factor-like phosphatase family protein n=1 Tax=Stylonychia lemnae TaxID=5949 RepID=A0A077ZQ67_STYLE|nr:nli interacting factor-like phosphatase family protein [Stylonychia lemnae]|eukprot:CDW72048.1 nli interacting factor-like phosphatase family protein [Stylonychia lemnae]
MNSHHSRRMTNIFGSTGQPLTNVSAVSSTTSTLQKQMSKPSIAFSSSTQSGSSQNNINHTRNTSTFGGNISKTEKQGSIASISNHSKISKESRSVKQGTKTPINVNKIGGNQQQSGTTQLSSPKTASTGSSTSIMYTNKNPSIISKPSTKKTLNNNLLKENQHPRQNDAVIYNENRSPSYRNAQLITNYPNIIMSNTSSNNCNNQNSQYIATTATSSLMEQKSNQILQPREADEFSFVAEHIEDEPSIHVRSITQFQSILKRPAMQKESTYDGRQTDFTTQTNGGGYNQYICIPPNVVYETFEEEQNQLTMNTNLFNNANQSRLVVNLLSQQDDTFQEPSAFFDEHNCSQSVLHKCQMIEMYSVPNKPARSDKIQSKKSEECYQILNQLIAKVKQDVSQSIIMNQSKNYMLKNSNQNSRIYSNNNLYKQTDMTNESAFPNITNEELHFSINKYNNFHGTGASTSNMMIGNILDDSNSQFIGNGNNSTIGNITNSTINNNGGTNGMGGGQQSTELHKLHLLQTLQSLQYIKQVERPSEDEISKKSIFLPPPRIPQQQKKTLIFDLDETLIHCIDDLESEVPDTILNIAFPNGEMVQAGINVRPYALECLREANKKYQVVVFTASHKFYADVVLDYLDPKGELVHYRLYRDSCFQTEDGVYIKDLRIIKNRSLKDMVIVDNAVYSFGFQLDNGIPIIPFYNNREDEELLHLINYINTLAFFNDLREQNAKAFQLKELENAEITDYLEYFFGGINNGQQNVGKPHIENNPICGISQDSQAIKEEENESENSYQQNEDNNNNKTDNSSMINAEMNPPLETTSELDQEEILKCKKRLNFIELSSNNSQITTPDGKELNQGTGIQTPAYLKSISNSKNSSSIFKTNQISNDLPNAYKGGNNKTQNANNYLLQQRSKNYFK